MADTRSPSEPRIEPEAVESKGNPLSAAASAGTGREEAAGTVSGAGASPEVAKATESTPIASVTALPVDGVADRGFDDEGKGSGDARHPLASALNRGAAGGRSAASPAVAAPVIAPTPAAVLKAPKARGRWLAVSAAVVALAAAGLSISGPSLRPEIAAQLTRQFGEQRWIAIATGTALPPPPDAVTITLSALDQRLSGLVSLINQNSGQNGTSLDPATLRALAQALGQPLPPPQPSPEAPRIAALEQQIGELTSRLVASEAALKQTEAALTASLTESLATGLAEATAREVASAKAISDELSGRLSEITQTQAANHEALVREGQALAASLNGRLEDGAAAALARIATVEQSLQEQQAAVGSRLDAIAAEAGRVDDAFKLALLSRLRFAFELSTPFDEDVAALASLWKTDEAETRAAIQTLAGLANKGVSSMSRLQRDLMVVMNGIVQLHTAPAPGWIDQATVMLGITAEPPPSQADTLREQGRVIAQEIHNGKVGSALWKLRALEVPLDARAQAWVQEANRRMAADEALATLTNRILKSTGGA